MSQSILDLKRGHRGPSWAPENYILKRRPVPCRKPAAEQGPGSAKGLVVTAKGQEENSHWPQCQPCRAQLLQHML